MQNWKKGGNIQILRELGKNKHMRWSYLFSGQLWKFSAVISSTTNFVKFPTVYLWVKLFLATHVCSFICVWNGKIVSALKVYYVAFSCLEWVHWDKIIISWEHSEIEWIARYAEM